MEILGNVVDNACKLAEGRVRVRVGGKRHGLASHTCSGFKQLQVLLCLFKADRLIRKCSDTYLEESATVMRSHLGKIRGDVDKATIKVLERNEVRFQSRADPGRNLLRVGNVSVTKGFAELVFSEFLLSGLRMKTTRHRLVVHFLRAGCRIAELLPVEADFWVVLLEKILYSTAIRQRVRALIDECWRHGEFAHVSWVQPSESKMIYLLVDSDTLVTLCSSEIASLIRSSRL